MILDRYIVKETIPNVLIGLLVFTFVMLMNQILLLAQTLITRGVEITNLFLIIFYSLPALTVLTIPMSLLLGTLLSLGRLNSDSELTVIRVSGVSLYRLIFPIVSIGVVCWLICAYLIQVSVPWGNYALEKLMFRILTTNAASELKPRVFYNQFPNLILYVQDIPSNKNDEWQGVFLYDESDIEKPRLVLAQQGIVHPKGSSGDSELELKDGSWHEVDPRTPQDYTYVGFLTNIFPLPSPLRFSGGEIPKSDREQTIPELKKSVAENRARRLPTAYLEVEIQKKYAIPFACVVFSFLALGLGISSKKGGRSSAYAISIGIILIYYIFLIGGERLGDAEKVSPWLAAWAGNVSMGLLGLLLFFQTNNNIMTKIWQKARQVARHLLRRRTISGQELRRIRVVIRVERFPFRLFTLLDRYVVREFLKNLLLIMIALVCISELIEGTQMVDDMLRNKVPLDVMLSYLKFHMPQWVFFVLPVSALTTTLVTFGLFSKNSEIVAMKASGVSLYRISLPVVILALLLSAFAFWEQEYILPQSNKVADDYRRQLKGLPPETYSSFQHHWLSGAEGFFNYEMFDLRKNLMHGFSIYEVDLQHFNLIKRIYANAASYEDNQWHLKMGWERTFPANGRIKFRTFKNDRIKLSVTPEYFKTEEELPAQMTYAELKAYIAKMKARGYDIIRFAVDLQAKLSFPMVTLVVTLIAIPFSFTMGKRGALYGIGLSIVMGIVFWFFLALTKALGYLEILDPFLAAWAPNILAALLALYLLFKVRT
jgi:LPS export ABC transporter permease LptG/LPS export ABC transporter permease LptF